jgi:hypothetical protein
MVIEAEMNELKARVSLPSLDIVNEKLVIRTFGKLAIRTFGKLTVDSWLSTLKKVKSERLG